MRLFDDEAKSQVIHHVYPAIKFITRSHHTNATQCMHNREVARVDMGGLVGSIMFSRNHFNENVVTH